MGGLLEKKGKHYNHGHIGKSLFYSYIILAILSVISNLFIYIYTASHIHDNITRIHMKESEKISYQLNAILDEAMTQTVNLGHENIVGKLLDLEIEENYRGSQAMMVRDLLQVFKDVMGDYDSIAMLALYDLHNQSMIVLEDINSRSILHEEECTQYLLDEMSIGRDALKRISDNERIGIYIAQPGRKDCRIYYIVNLYSVTFGQPEGVLICEISLEKINEILDMYNYQDNGYYLVSAQHGYLGTDENVKNMIHGIDKEALVPGELYSFMENYMPMVCTQIPLTASDLSCYYISSYGTYYQTFLAAVCVILLNVGVLSLATIFLAKYFEKKNTKPLERMLLAVAPQADVKKQLTFNYMETTIQNVMDKMKQLERFWNNDFLSLILFGQETNEKVITKYERERRLNHPLGYRILSVRLLNGQDPSSGDIRLFCINNIIGELLDKYIVEAPAKDWSSVYFILKNDEAFDECIDIIKKGLEFLQQKLGIATVAGISGAFSHLTGLRSGRIEAEYAVELAELSGGRPGKVVFYDNITETPEKEDTLYSTKLRRLMQLILNQNFSGAIKLFETNIRMLKEQAGRDFNVVKEQNVFTKLRDFIEENYGNINLNVGYISDYFHLSNSYITNIFKKNTGEGVLDYIHKVRIRHAKEFLKEGKSVSETAALTGYTDARGFIRAFKRYEGITPGQYKLL